MRVPRPLLAFAAVPVVLPVIVLAASPSRLAPGFPRYRYEALPGDAYGYYYCALEVYSTARRDAPLVALAVLVAAAICVYARRVADRAWRTVLYSAAVGVVAAALAGLMHFTGAAQVGWPFLWAVALAPLRAVGAAQPRHAFAVGLALSIACNVATVLATWALGRRSGLGPRAALGGAALVALWPLLILLVGHDAATNGTWQIWLGLSLYTEPLSTALVTAGLALALTRGDRPAAWAGILLGFATLVRLSNVLVLVCVLAGFAVWRGRRSVLLAAAGAATWGPAAILYWPESYPKLKPPVFPAHPFGLSYVIRAWSDTTLWRPAVLLVLVPVAALGVWRATPFARAVLVAAVAATAIFYSFYELTPIHPRFLFVVVPVVLVLWAAGAATIAALVTARRSAYGP